MTKHTLLASLVLATVYPVALPAQSFPIKTSLAAGGITGCAPAAPPLLVAPTPAAEAEAQQLIAEGQDAALTGEHAAARAAFARAAALMPGNARLAYYLGREHEALSEQVAAVREYCRYLALSPAASDGDEVRGRIVRLTPAEELRRLEEARANFQSGVALLRRRQYAAADSVFEAVATAVPSAPEPFFNRALSRAARGARPSAMMDFESYLSLSPRATDEQAVRAAMSRLPDRVHDRRRAVGSGLLVPGLGQMNTGRPVFGLAVLATVGTATWVALRQTDKVEARSFTDPFGNPYVDSVTVLRRPHAVYGLGGAVALWLGAALESGGYAQRSRRNAEAIIAQEAGLPPGRSGVRAGLTIVPLAAQRLGVGAAVMRW